MSEKVGRNFPRPSVPAHQDGNEITGPVQPALRAIDAIWPADPGIRMAQAKLSGLQDHLDQLEKALANFSRQPGSSPP